MQSRDNREFKNLIEKVYEQRFQKEDYIKKLIEEIKTIPSFYYNNTSNTMRIELKEDEARNNTSDLSQFYNKLQNIDQEFGKNIVLEIKLDERISKRILYKYIDIIHFVNKANTKYYTKRYFKEKILVELQALEDILEYSIQNQLSIKVNGKEVESVGNELDIRFSLKNIDGIYFFTLEQNIKDFRYILVTNNYIYIYYSNKIYKCKNDFINRKYIILNSFLESYKNDISISRENLTNFFSLIYPDIKENTSISTEVLEEIKKYMPKELKKKLYLDFDERNYLIADLKFVYEDIEFNPIDNTKVTKNRNILEESIYLNKLIKSGFLLDEKNKRLIINNDDIIFNFIENDLDEYVKESEVYTTDNFKNKRLKKIGKTSIGVKVNNNLLEINFKDLPIDKKELKEVLQKYKLNKKYHRLKDGSFLSLEDNQDFEFIDTFLDGLDLSYKSISEDIIRIPINRSLYLEKLLESNTNIAVEKDEKYTKIISDIDSKVKNVSIPKELEGILRDYQKIGNNWLTVLKEYGFGGILADDMGLGKTIQILSVILGAKLKDKKYKTSLVVAPSSLMLNWKSEAEKFTKDLSIIVINGDAEERIKKIKQINKYDLAITSYDLLKRDIEEYEKENYTFTFLIADEAQYIKNNNTKNSRAIKRINADAKYALTGTPIENSLSELWSIFDFIMPGYLFSYKKFKKNYEVPIVLKKDDEAMQKLKMLIEPFVLRRTKKEVLKELPDKSTIVLNNEMTEEQEKVYLSYLLRARDELNYELEDKGFEQSRIKILALLTRLRQICCHPSLFIQNYKDGSGKLNQCIELVKEGIQSGHKILLFSGYTSMFEIIERALKNEGINYLKLTGKTKINERFELIEEFNSNEDVKVFLISLKAGGTGINLTSADMVIHYDPWWNISVENQATDRTHRIGQTKKVQVYKLITKNSIEEKIYDLQQRKKELIDNMLSTDTTFINKLSKEDILKLFE